MPCDRSNDPGQPLGDTSFGNWSQMVTGKAQLMFAPASIEELVAIVKQAEAQQMRVRAVGSGWSFPNNMTPSDDADGNPWGVIVQTYNLNNVLGFTMEATILDWDFVPQLHRGKVFKGADDPVCNSFTARAKAKKLIHVQAGAKLNDLNWLLEYIRPTDPMGNVAEHGYALPTLGGSGGQSIAGVVSTSVHGGDIKLPPVPDMVQGIHLVAAGGVEYFIQRAGKRAIVHPAKLAALMPCVATRVISNDDVFNAVMVSVGRMGIIYSLVLEVRDQYFLTETRWNDLWPIVGDDKLSALRDPNNNRFLQIVLFPYGLGCSVTTRVEEGFKSWLNLAAPGSLPCDAVPIYELLSVPPLTALLTLKLLPEATARLGLEGPLAAFDTDTQNVVSDITGLLKLLNFWITLGDFMAAVTNLLVESGLKALAQNVVVDLLSSGLPEEVDSKRVSDLGFKVMDKYNYDSDCFISKSLEVAFDADGTSYLDYVGDLLGLIQQFSDGNILYGGYISLRYCGRSEALLAIEQFERTVVIETASLSGLDQDLEVLTAFQNAAISRGGILHWGQHFTPGDDDGRQALRNNIDQAFGKKLDLWRSVLAFVSAGGSLNTFDNDFCQIRGLEVLDAKPQPFRNVVTDLSYLVPLLSPAITKKKNKGKDLSYLVPILMN